CAASLRLADWDDSLIWRSKTTGSSEGAYGKSEAFSASEWQASAQTISLPGLTLPQDCHSRDQLAFRDPYPRSFPKRSTARISVSSFLQKQKRTCCAPKDGSL